MYHRQRWTPEKIKQRLDLISSLVYIKRKALPSFRYKELANPTTHAPIEVNVDDSSWKEIDSNEYWGSWMQDFVLRTTFMIPEFMDASQPIALYLPIGDAGDFSHPECLAYIDGQPFATCDRHHQEFLLRPERCDGGGHTLALHWWTGLGGGGGGDFYTKPGHVDCAVLAGPRAVRHRRRPSARTQEMPDSLIEQLARECGIADAYENHRGERTPISLATRTVILAAKGYPTEDAAGIERAMRDREAAGWRSLLPPVTVVHPGRNSVEVSIDDADLERPLEWGVALERGGEVTGRVRCGELAEIGRGHVDGCPRTRRRLELPADLTHGYHSLRAGIEGGVGADCVLMTVDE